MGVPILRSSVSLSLLFHGFFLLFCAFVLSRQDHRGVAPRPYWIEIETPQQAKVKSPEAEAFRTRKQIVQTEKGKVLDRAPPEAFLGERNQRVDRETVSKSRTTVMGRQAPHPSLSPTRMRSRASRSGNLSSLGIAIPIPKKEPVRPEDEIAEVARQSVQFEGSGAPSDYVKGFKESERTALNTREYVFYGYFQRIRERLDRAWVPILRQKLVRIYKSGRQLASDMDYSTRVMVVLDGHGEIVRVEILSESGTQDLDEAAVRAFNQAGPFPNPPRGMVNAQGEVRIPWEFILKS